MEAPVRGLSVSSVNSREFCMSCIPLITMLSFYPYVVWKEEEAFARTRLSKWLSIAHFGKE